MLRTLQLQHFIFPCGELARGGPGRAAQRRCSGNNLLKCWALMFLSFQTSSQAEMTGCLAECTHALPLTLAQMQPTRAVEFRKKGVASHGECGLRRARSCQRGICSAVFSALGLHVRMSTRTASPVPQLDIAHHFLTTLRCSEGTSACYSRWSCS